MLVYVISPTAMRALRSAIDPWHCNSLAAKFWCSRYCIPFLSLQYYSSYEMAATTRHGSDDETENLG
jgi:hypothetical protein